MFSSPILYIRLTEKDSTKESATKPNRPPNNRSFSPVKETSPPSSTSLSIKYGSISDLVHAQSLPFPLPQLLKNASQRMISSLLTVPFSPAGRLLTNLNTIGTSPYGQHWQNLRGLAAVEIFS